MGRWTIETLDALAVRKIAIPDTNAGQ